jgi:hypothetical protein
MADIFISYAHEDETRVQALVSVFETRGWSVFWDRHIPAGATWRSHIGAALDEARCILVVWSEHSVASDWVSEEADEGKRRRILIPVILGGVLPPRGFREVQAADLADWEPGEPSGRLDRLSADIAQLLSRVTAAPAAAAANVPATGPRFTAPHISVPASAAPEPVRPVMIDDVRHRAGTQPASGVRPRLVMGAVAVLAVAAIVGYVALRPTGRRELAAPRQPSPAAPSTQSAPPAVQPRPSRPQPQWLVVAGSYPPADARVAQRRRQVLLNAGHDAVTIDTNDYPLLRPNLSAVVIGPFVSRAEANAALAQVKHTVQDAYVRQGR